MSGQQLIENVCIDQKSSAHRGYWNVTQNSSLSKLSGWDKRQQVTGKVTIHIKSAADRKCRVVKTVAHRKVRSEYRTASHLESQEETQNTAAYRKCQNRRSQQSVSDSSKRSAGYRKSQNETEDTIAYRKRVDNESAGHQTCQN
jgi:hypothetical protein